MSNSKLRIVVQNGSAIAQTKNGRVSAISCIDKGDGPASAEENLRLLKAFSRIDDVRRRAWLLELIEHFARLDPAAH
jgi:hypothetical protein